MSFNSDITHLAINGQSTSYQQLFPYLYIGNTPKVSEQDISNAFFQIPDKITQDTSPTSLFFQLAEEKDKKNRLAMQNLAVAFINGGGFIRTFYQLGDQLLAVLNTPLSNLSSTTDIRSCIESNFKTVEGFETFLKDSEATLKNVWLSIITMLIELDYERKWLEQLLTLVRNLNILNHSLPYLSANTEIPEALLRTWRNANLLLSDQVFPLPKQTLTNPTPPVNSKVSPELVNYAYARPYAIGTLHLVKYKLIGYELGELKKVESILQGETRKRSHRQQLTTHNQGQSTASSEQHNDKTDHIVDQDFNSQIQKTLAERKVTNTADNLATDYSPTSPKATTNGSWTVDENPAGGSAENTSNFIKDVLAETKQRVASQINNARQNGVEQEEEHSRMHTFSNTTERNINGFYYWLNKTYRVNAEDSQKRLLVEVNFELDDAELHQILAEQNRLKLTPPITLEQAGVNSYQDILAERPEQQQLQDNSMFYLDLCQQFAVTNVPSPLAEKSFYATSIKSEQSTCNNKIVVPEGYLIESANIVVAVDAKVDVDDLAVTLAGETITMSKVTDATSTITRFKGTLDATKLSEPIHSELPFAVMTEVKTNCQFSSYPNDENAKATNETVTKVEVGQNISVQLQLKRSEQALNQWQFNVFNLLQAGHSLQVKQYDEDLEELKQWLEANNNPQTQALINNYLIKKCMYRLYLNAMASIGKDPSSPMAELPYNQYFNQALDWPNLYCKLSEQSDTVTSALTETPTAKNNTASDKTVHRVKSPTPINTTKGALAQLDSELYLKRFLTATHAKILLPVNLEQELSFIYFLDSGQIWHGEESLVPINQIALPIANDFKKLEHTSRHEFIETGSWKVTLPTTMSVLSDREHLDDIGSHLDE